MSFWPVDGILFQEYPFSSSSNNHLTWQCSISLCTCAPSSKYIDGSDPHVCCSRHQNLIERNPGVKIKMHFQRHIAPQLFIRIHQILYKFSEICSFEISQKTIRNLFKVNSTVVTLMPKVLPYFLEVRDP